MTGALWRSCVTDYCTQAITDSVQRKRLATFTVAVGGKIYGTCKVYGIPSCKDVR